MHLVDPVPLHVEQARAASNGYSAALGDACGLREPDASADAVLLLGPLYHLTDRGDRLLALAETRRIVRPGHMIFAAAISRFASLLDALWWRELGDPEHARVIERDVLEGRHDNPAGREWFTTAYYHKPEQLAQEIADAGLQLDTLLAVEGPGWLVPDFDNRWLDERQRQQLLQAIASVEHESSVLGVSNHLLAVAHRPLWRSDRL